MRKIFFWLILGLLVLTGGWRVSRLLTKSVWDGRGTLNIVLNSQPLLVVSLDLARENPLNFLVVPSTTIIEVIQGYGDYKAESIYPLGELENKTGELLMGSFQEYFGVPIQGYVADGETKESLEKIVINLIKGKGETNLTKWDLIRLWWQATKVRSDKREMVDLGQAEVGEEIVLPDGTKAFQIDKEKTDKIISKLFKDSQMRAEDFSIAVQNGTGYLGLANRGARLITNIGGRVIEIGDWEAKVGRCELRTNKSLLKSYTVRILMKVFSCQWGGEDTGGHRAEMILVLGEDYFAHLTQKGVK